METISRVIVSLVYYNSLLRDTLEYTLNRHTMITRETELLMKLNSTHL